MSPLQLSLRHQEHQARGCRAHPRGAAHAAADAGAQADAKAQAQGQGGANAHAHTDA